MHHNIAPRAKNQSYPVESQLIIVYAKGVELKGVEVLHLKRSGGIIDANVNLQSTISFIDEDGARKAPLGVIAVAVAITVRGEQLGRPA